MIQANHLVIQGGLSDRVAEWLEERITEYPEKPTLVFTHHPPFVTGLPAMDEGFDQADRLAQILNKHENVTLCCGHMHTAILHHGIKFHV